MSGNRDLLFVALAVAVSGCATQTQWITFPGNDGGKGVTLEAWLQQHPLKPDEEVGLVELSRGETASSHLVQIRKGEGLHLHESHDLIAILKETFNKMGANKSCCSCDKTFRHVVSLELIHHQDTKDRQGF